MTWQWTVILTSLIWVVGALVAVDMLTDKERKR